MLKKRIFGILTAILAVMLVFALLGCTGKGGRTFNDVEKVEDWLARQKGGGSPDDPIPFKVKQNLQNMASGSNWHKLLTSIDRAGLYVSLDLSGCTMPTTEFDANGGITPGKKFIVSLILPDSTETIAGVLLGHFGNLKNARAKKIAYLIGDTGPAGGIVFYDKGNSDDGWRYLEAAPQDMETPLCWVAQSYGSIPNVEGTRYEIGTGRQNTALILAVDANAPAAKACTDYRGGGFSDWFLPSSGELNLMYRNLKVNNIGGFWGDWYYCSSSQNDYDHYCAWGQNFGNGFQFNERRKYVVNDVRAVRAF